LAATSSITRSRTNSAINLYRSNLVGETIHNAAELMYPRQERASPYIKVKELHASRGKVVRCEPVSLLYEKDRVLHQPGLDNEAEMLSFNRDWDRAV
jgi:phage terminase large subunit-like protein